MTMRSLRLPLVAVVICAGLQLSVPARSDTGAQCGHPIATGDGWQTASPDEMGMDAVRLCSLNEMLGETSAPIHEAAL